MVSICNQERGRDADEERGTEDRTSCHPWTTGILLKGLPRLHTAESPSAPQGHLFPWLLICMADLQREDGPCHLTVLFKMKTNKQKQQTASFMDFVSYSLPYFCSSTSSNCYTDCPRERTQAGCHSKGRTSSFGTRCLSSLCWGGAASSRDTVPV